MERGIMVALTGLLLVISEVIYAYEDKFFFVSQMLEQGFKQGIPLVAHAGVWGDLFVITPLSAWVVYNYADYWAKNDIITSFFIGLAITVPLVIFWVIMAKYGLPEALAHGGRLTWAGFFHALFMFGAVTIFILFFFYSGVSQKAATVVAIILGVHIFCGSHVPLGLIGPDWYPDRPHKNLVTWAVILISWSALAWRCLTIR